MRRRKSSSRSIDGKPLTTPRVLKFQTGRRRQVWNKNCVALGLAERIHRTTGIDQHSPDDGGRHALDASVPVRGVTQSVIDQYNEAARIEMEKTRDFIVLHYHATQRDDTPFWRHCRDMPIPDSLAQRIELFRQSAYAFQGDDELFRVDSWTQVMLGQRIMPKSYHHAARLLGAAGAHQVSRRVSRFDSPDSRAHAGAPGLREPVLQGEQQRLELSGASNRIDIRTRIRDFDVQKLTIGRELAPLLVIDNLVADPGRARGYAAGKVFRRRCELLPRRAGQSPLTYQQFSLGAAAWRVRENSLDSQAGTLRFTAVSLFGGDHAAGKTLAPAAHSAYRFSVRQRTRFRSLSIQADLGGTAFYRHRRTGFRSRSTRRAS